MLRGRVEPAARRLDAEVATVLPEAALAHVEDLLALEQRVDDDRPFLATPSSRRAGSCVHNRRAMDDTILSGDLRLSAHVAMPSAPGPGLGLVLCHGLPNPPRGAATVGTTYPDLADRIAAEAGWAVLTFNFRGTGTSEGDFSARGWLDDLRNAVRALHARAEVRGVWVAGFGHGGTFAVCDAADDHLVRGRGDHRVAEHAARLGAGPGPAPGAHAVDGHDPHAGVPDRRHRVGARHRAHRRRRRGGTDSTVDRCWCCTASRTSRFRSTTPARSPTPAGRTPNCGSCRAPGHRLRHDPRAIATLLGWLARQVPSGAPADLSPS